MTSVIRRVAGGLSILEAIWMIYTLYEAPLIVCSTNLCLRPLDPPYSQILMGVAGVLLVVGLIGIWGSWFAYPAGALLSAVLLAVMGYSAWIESEYAYVVSETLITSVGAAMTAAALIVNLVAWRAQNVLSEQANPMNLPVFG